MKYTLNNIIYADVGSFNFRLSSHKNEINYISSIGYNAKNNKFEFIKKDSNFIDEVFYRFKSFHTKGIITNYSLYDKLLK